MLNILHAHVQRRLLFAPSPRHHREVSEERTLGTGLFSRCALLLCLVRSILESRRSDLSST